MNGYRLLYLAAIAALLLSLSLGCSSGEDASSTDKAPGERTPVASNEPLTDSAQIAQAFNEVIERVAYGDKSGMWENEFSYLRDDQTFEYYRTTHQMVTIAKKDTLDSVQIMAVEFFKPDSAIADVRLHFTGPTNVQSKLDQPVTVYWRRGKWIKPTVSVMSHQAQYDEIIRRADSAAQAEAERNGG